MGQKDAKKKGSEKKGSGGGGVSSDGGVTVVLKADLHCEGCAQKVKRTIKHLDGVESVKAEFASKTLTVVGKVDPTKVKAKVEEKTKKKVDLVSPKQQPPPPNKEKDQANGGANNSDEKPEKKPPPADDNNTSQQKKPKEAAVTTVLLKTKVHCDGCAHKINKIINKCEGVKEVTVDLAKDQITLKGTMNMTEMLPYLNTKLKRVVEMVAASPKKDEGDKKKAKGSPSGDTKGKEVANPAGETQEVNTSKIEVVNKMEYSGYPNGYGAYAYNPQQAQESGYVAEYWNGPDYMHPPDYMNAPPQYMHMPDNMNAPPHYLHAPQMFSDENPNACSVM